VDGKVAKSTSRKGKSRLGPYRQTDKTAGLKVLSVLSGQPESVSNIVVNPKEAATSAGCAGSLSGASENVCADNRCGWDEEDWQAAFEERAAIFEFDERLPRQDAESLAWRQIEAQRKRWMQ